MSTETGRLRSQLERLIISTNGGARFWGWMRELGALALLVGFLHWYLGLFGHALIDDAFITLNYVRSLTSSGTWGFLPGHLANTATSPLNVVLLAAISLVAGSIPASPIWLATASYGGLVIALDRASGRLRCPRWIGWLAAAAFVFNPWIVSTLGLEGILFCSLLVTSFSLTLARKWLWTAVSLGLLSITRADGLLFSLIFLLYVPRPQTLKSAGVVLVTAAPWYLFSWLYLGSFLPDSLIIRVTQTSWEGATFLTGPALYFQRYPAETLVSFASLAILPSLLLRDVRKSRMVHLVLALGLTHFLAYSLLHVPPYHWYYLPECAALILFAMLALAALFQAHRWKAWRYGVTAVVVAALALPLAATTSILAQHRFNITEMPIHTNLATEARYRQVGLELRGRVGSDPVLTEGEIGTVGYYCNCMLLDSFSDRRWLAAGVSQVIDAGGISAALYELNFRFLRPDPGFPPYAYILTIRSDPEAAGHPYLYLWKASTTWSPKTWIVLARLPAAGTTLEQVGARHAFTRPAAVRAYR